MVKVRVMVKIGWDLVVEDIELLFKMTMRCALPPH